MKKKSKDVDMGTRSRKYFGYTKNGYFHFNGKKKKLSQEDNYIED